MNPVNPTTELVPNPYFQQIQEAYAAVRACRTKWKRLDVRLPHPSLANHVEEMVAQEKAQLLKRGVQPERIEQAEQATRAGIVRHIEGYEQLCFLTCAYREGAYWCEIHTVFSAEQVSGENDGNAYSLNYLDSKHAIELSQSVLRLGQAAEEALWLGSLTPVGMADVMPMPNVATPNLAFLVGSEPTPNDISKCKVVEDSAHEFTLEMEGESGVHRITFSKTFWKPLLDERINVFTGKATRRTEFMGYQCFNGAWIPTEVVRRSFKGDGSLGTTETYTLLEANFDAEADVSILEKPLPVGAIINDYRFAPRPGARYKVGNGHISDDATVLRLVEERERRDAMGGGSCCAR